MDSVTRTIPLTMVVDGSRQTVGSVDIKQEDYSLVKARLHPEFQKSMGIELKQAIHFYKRGL